MRVYVCACTRTLADSRQLDEFGWRSGMCQSELPRAYCCFAWSAHCFCYDRIGDGDTDELDRGKFDTAAADCLLRFVL